MKSHIDDHPPRTTKLSASAVAAVAGDAAGIGDLVLRLVGGEHHGRVIRIHATKCTIGSAPGCTLRLKAPGVEPIHALIMRGPQGAIIRRYGDKLSINEAEIDDASLRKGDRLQIGPIKLTVLGPNSTEDDVRLVTSPSALKLQKSFSEQVRKARRVGHARLKRLLRTIREQRQQVRDISHSADRRKLELDRLGQQLTTVQRELTAERERQLAADQEQRTTLLQVDQLTHSLERLRQDFLATQTRHRQDSDHWRLDQSRLTEDITERDRRLHLLQGELAQRQWDLEQQQTQLKRIQRQYDVEREQHEATRERLQREAVSRQEEATHLREELQQQERKELQTRQELVQKQRECEQLRQQHERLQRELNQERALLAGEQRALHSDGAQWELQRQELRNEVCLQQSVIEQLETKLTKQETIANNFRRELEICQQTLVHFREQTEAARRSWEDERLQIIAQVSSAAAQDANLVTGKQSLIDDLREQLAQSARHLIQRQEEIAAHLNELSQLRQQALSNENAWQIERSRLLQLVDERDRQLTEAKDLEARLASKAVEHQTEVQERERLERELARQADEFNRQCDEVRRYRVAESEAASKLEHERAQRLLAEATCEELRAALSQHVDAGTQERLALQEALVAEQENSATLTAAIAQSGEREAVLQAELQSALESQQSLQGEILRIREELASVSQPPATQTLAMTSSTECSTEEVEAREELARRTAELQQQLNALREQELALAARSEEHDACRAALEQQRNELQQEMNSLAESRQVLDQGHATLAAQAQAMAEREQQLNALATELQVRSEQLQSGQDNLQSLACQLEQLQQQLHGERRELATAREQMVANQQQSVALTVEESSTHFEPESTPDEQSLIAGEAIDDAREPQVQAFPIEEIPVGYQPTSSWGTFQMESTLEEAQEDLERLRNELTPSTVSTPICLPNEEHVDEVMGTENATSEDEEPVSQTIEISSLKLMRPEDYKIANEFAGNADDGPVNHLLSSEETAHAPDVNSTICEGNATSEIFEAADETSNEKVAAVQFVEESSASSATNEEEDRFLLPTVWNDASQASVVEGSPQSSGGELCPSELPIADVSSIFTSDAELTSVDASPFPDFSADDLAQALSGPASNHSPVDPNLPAPLHEGNSSPFPTDYGVSPEKLPAWSYEHERPARVDTITGLRIQNMLHESGEFSAERQSQSGLVLPVNAEPDDDSTRMSEYRANIVEFSAESAVGENCQSDSDADIFARLRAAGIVKDLDSAETSDDELNAGVPFAAISPESSLISEESLANALLDEEPTPSSFAPVGATGLVSSAFIRPENDDPNAEGELACFNRPGSAAAAASDSADDEESIESYMQQLLSRVRGDAPPSGSGPNPVYKAAVAPQSKDVEQKPKAVEAKPINTTPVTKEEYIPRSTAPEQSMSLAAMREVANSQARSALQTHAKKVGKRKSSGRFFASAVALALGATGLSWGIQTSSLPATAGGLIGLIVGAYWLIQGLWLARGAISKALVLEQPGAKQTGESETVDD